MIKIFMKFFLTNPIGQSLILFMVLSTGYRVGIMVESHRAKKETVRITTAVDINNQQYDRHVGKINSDFILHQNELRSNSESLQTNANSWGDLLDAIDYRMSLIPTYSVEPISTGTTDIENPSKEQCIVHRAEFSKEALAFSKSEARRADYCAVQLIEANRTIDNLLRAVSDYNDNLRARGVSNELLINP